MAIQARGPPPSPPLQLSWERNLTQVPKKVVLFPPLSLQPSAAGVPFSFLLSPHFLPCPRFPVGVSPHLVQEGGAQGPGCGSPALGT